MESLIRIARSPDWPGYFGSPRLAEASRAANGWHVAAQQAISLALRILDGLSEKTTVRFGDEMRDSQTDVQLDKASLRHKAAIERRQHQWLKCHGLR
jgi:hypothetical protein